jgi:hypothetical protein
MLEPTHLLDECGLLFPGFSKYLKLRGICNVRAMGRIEIGGVQTERNIQMKMLSTAAITSVVALVGLSIVPTFADEYETMDTIGGRSTFAIESALRDRGMITSGVEEWGGLIRAWVPNANGGTSMLFFDADTLQPVSPSRG